MKSKLQVLLFLVAFCGIATLALAASNKIGAKSMPDPKNDAGGGPDIVSTGFTSEPIDPGQGDGSNRKICFTVCFVGDCSAGFAGGFKFTLGDKNVRVKKTGSSWAYSANGGPYFNSNISTKSEDGICCITVCLTNVELGLDNVDEDPLVPDSTYEHEFKVESFENADCTGNAKDDNGTPKDANNPSAGKSYPKVKY